MGSGNPGSGGPPAGATGSGGDAGPVSEQGNKGADRSLETGNPGPGGPPGGATGSGGDAGLGGAVYSQMVRGKTGGVLKVKGTDPNSQVKGRGRRSALSRNRQQLMSLQTGSGNPVTDVRLKQGKDNTGKNPSKEKPAKGKTVADPNTGSKGKPVHDSGVKPAESKVDSMDTEVQEEVNQAFLQALEQKK